MYLCINLIAVTAGLYETAIYVENLDNLSIATKKHSFLFNSSGNETVKSVLSLPLVSTMGSNWNYFNFAMLSFSILAPRSVCNFESSAPLTNGFKEIIRFHSDQVSQLNLGVPDACFLAPSGEIVWVTRFVRQQKAIFITMESVPNHIPICGVQAFKGFPV